MRRRRTRRRRRRRGGDCGGREGNRLRKMEIWKGLFWVMVLMALRRGDGQLAENFYRFSCPNVEAIVRQTVLAKLNITFVTVPATLRLFFHDCFVEVINTPLILLHVFFLFHFFEVNFGAFEVGGLQFGIILGSTTTL